MEKNDRQLDIEQLSRIVENVEPQSDVSVDDILAEYSNEVNNSNFLQHVAYLPDTDRDLEKTIKSVVSSVMDEEDKRRQQRRKLEEQTKKQNRREQKFETSTKLKEETINKKRQSKKKEDSFNIPLKASDTRTKIKNGNRTEKTGDDTVRLPSNISRAAEKATKSDRKKSKVIYMNSNSSTIADINSLKQAEEQRNTKDKNRRRDTKPPSPEMSLKDAAKKYKRVGSMAGRAAVGGVLCLALLYLSAAPELGLSSPTIAGYGGIILFVILNILVVLLCFDRFMIGMGSIFMLQMDANSLISMANILSIADGIVLLISKNDMLPMNAVCSLALVISLIGEYKRRRALMLTFKTASAVSDPYVVTSENSHYCGKPALIKSETGTVGAVPAALSRDGTTNSMLILAPILLFICPVLAILSAVVGKAEGDFLHRWSILAAVSLPVSAALAYCMPYARLAKKLSRSGSAIMGYRGAKLIAKRNCVVITDKDVFPAGFVTLNGMKLMGGRPSERVISATAILIRASGSNLSRIFTDLMNEHMGIDRKLEEFEFMEGGFGGIVGGEYVMCGTAKFMHERGVVLPEGMKVKNAVFTAFGTDLAGVFALNYTASPTVATSLNRMIYSGCIPLLISADFNVTPQLIASKFKLREDDIEAHKPQDIYTEPEIFGTPAAVVCREGLSPLGDTVAAGRRLAKAVRLNTWFSIISSLLGCFLCFWLMALGAQNTLTCGKIVVYVLAWMVPVLLVSGNSNL